MAPALAHRAKALLKRLQRDTKGAIALLFALFAPAVAMLSVGAIDLSAVMTAKSRLQDIADAAALAGAPFLDLATDGTVARERSASFVAGLLSQWSDAPTVVETYEVVTVGGQRGIRVLLQANRQSFFVSMLPPGGWNFVGDATATSVGRTPLCILATGTSSEMIRVHNSSGIAAPDCGLQSNAGIMLDGAARIDGAKIQAVLNATGGTMTPDPGEGAPSIVDPFASISFPNTNGCPFYGNGQANPLIYGPGGTHYLAPDIHCRPIIARQTTLILNPGDHFFRKNLVVESGSQLIGEDVFLFFDHGSDPIFTGLNSRVDLIGRKSGAYAGLVLATTAGNSPNIEIPGGNVQRLLGVVYARNGFLEVSGSGVAAEDSAWTVIVARQVILRGTASIRINADYESSDVPVPNGVGPNGGGLGGNGTRLVN